MGGIQGEERRGEENGTMAAGLNDRKRKVEFGKERKGEKWQCEDRSRTMMKIDNNEANAFF